MARNDPDRSKEWAYATKYRDANRERITTYQHEWYKRKRESIKERRRAAYQANPKLAYLYDRRCTLKTKYGITLEIYDQMLQDQHGLCAICQLPKALVIDHNHKTKRVRALLCNNCNLGLGKFSENPELLKQAATYLESR